MNTFQYNDYKDLIRGLVQSNEQNRGYQGKLAQAAGCQKSYFSQVLNSHYHLSLDQAAGLCEFWHMTDDESEYFLELVNFARCQHPSLIKRIRNRLKALREKYEQQTKKLGASEVVDSEPWLYYSQWYWSAIHILVGIPKFQKVDAIARCLELPKTLVEDVLKSLEKQNLVELRQDRWLTKPTHRYLPPSSPLTTMNHSNWRQRAMFDAQRASASSLHYTSIQSHSEEDLLRLKQVFVDAIGTSRSIVEPSANDAMSCLCIDFFSVTS